MAWLRLRLTSTTPRKRLEQQSLSDVEKLLLMIVMVTQLGCAVVLETAVGSFIGGLAVEVVKDEMDEAEKDEAPQP